MDRKVNGVTKYEKTIVFFYNNKDTLDVTLYNGIAFVNIPKNKFEDDKRKYYTSANKYIICDIKKINKDLKNGGNIKKSIKTQFDAFITGVDNLKKISGGLVNMYKTGGNVPTATYLFYQFLPIEYEPEPISNDESKWLRMAISCGHTYAEKYEGVAYKYDIVSSYPAIQKSADFLIPYREGKFTTIKKFKLFNTAIYRCVVEKSLDENINKLFKYNTKSYYTSIDLSLASCLGLEIIMIVDKSPNVLYWERKKCLTGEEMFGDVIDTLFKLKNEGVAQAKDIMNCIWGVLSKKQTYEMVINEDSLEEFEPFNGRDIISHTPMKNNKIKICMTGEKLFVTDFARLTPFLLSAGRSRISHLMKDHIDNIVYSHTDSMITKIKLDIEIGDDIGQLKYEGYCSNFVVKNIIYKKGIFVV